MYEHKNYFEMHPVCQHITIDWNCRTEVKNTESAFDWLFGEDEDEADADHITSAVAKRASEMKPFKNTNFGPDFEHDFGK